MANNYVCGHPVVVEQRDLFDLVKGALQTDRVC